MHILLPRWLLPSLVLLTWPLQNSLLAQEEELQHGAKLLARKIQGVLLQFVVFDEARFRIEVVANLDSARPQTLSEWGLMMKSVAVCNGGYFEIQGCLPSGLEIVKSGRHGSFLQRADGGSLLVQNGKAALVWDTEFLDHPKITDMVQCSPWLVSEGRAWTPPTPGTTDTKNMRTFIATNGAGLWALGTAKSSGLVELARVLTTPDCIPGLKVQRALNLDGGPSTGLWVLQKDGQQRFLKPGWPVRNAVAIVPR